MGRFLASLLFVFILFACNDEWFVIQASCKISSSSNKKLKRGQSSIAKSKGSEKHPARLSSVLHDYESYKSNNGISKVYDFKDGFITEINEDAATPSSFHEESTVAGQTSTSPQTFPYCSGLIFDSYGRIDLPAMVNNCSLTASSPLSNPSIFTPNNATKVYMQIAINNLIEVDDLSNQVTLDFYFRLTWHDPRLLLPNELYGQVLPYYLKNDGFTVNQYGFENLFWTPDLTFIDSINAQVQAEVIKWKENGTIYWSRHYITTLMQANMNFMQYPDDRQNFTIRVQSYAYTSSALEIYPQNPALVLIDNAILCSDTNPECLEVLGNQIWTFKDYSSSVLVENQPLPGYPDRAFWTVYVSLGFERQSQGIVFRLALPVLILLVIVGISFYVAIEVRIDVAVNMILVVAALYLVIGQEIPFVGYLSKMDKYVTATFMLLAFTLFIFFISMQLERTQEKYPLRLFFRVFLLYFMRLAWMPTIFALYFFSFKADNNPQSVVILSSIVIAFAGFQSLSNFGKIKSSLTTCVLMLREKREKYNEDLQNKNKHDHHIKELTSIEKLVLRIFKDKFKVRTIHGNNDECNTSSEVKEVQVVQPQRSQARTVEMQAIFKNSRGSVETDPSGTRNPMGLTQKIARSRLQASRRDDNQIDDSDDDE
jgi:hypothetical protein